MFVGWKWVIKRSQASTTGSFGVINKKNYSLLLEITLPKYDKSINSPIKGFVIPPSLSL